MSVVPELRKSLVKAAARQAAPAPRRSRRPRLAGIGLTVGAATALAVVGVVLVLSGNPASPTASRPPLTGRPAALLVAERLLTQVRLPAGAVPVAADPAHLGGPAQGELPSASADVHRFFLVRGDPQSIVNAFQRLNAKLEAGGGGGIGEASSSAAGAAAPGGRSVVSSVSESQEISPLGRIRRELQVSATVAHGGRTGVRVDARAYWTSPRPAYTQLPAGIHTIVVRVYGASAKAISQGLKPATRLSAGRDVALVVSFFDALPLARAAGNAAPAGQSCSGHDIRMNFEGAHGRSLATGVMHPPCGLVELWTAHRHTLLTIEAPAAGFKPQTLFRVLVLLAGVA